MIKRFIQTSKLMRSLVHLIFAFLSLALNLEREFSPDNVLGLLEPPQTKIEDCKFVLQQRLAHNSNAAENSAGRERSLYRTTSVKEKSRERSVEA